MYLIDVAVVVVGTRVVAVSVTREGTVTVESVESGSVPGRIVAVTKEELLSSFLILSILGEHEGGQNDQNQKALNM